MLHDNNQTASSVRLGIDIMNLYHLPCKADNGLGSDILPWEPREYTPMEIKSSVAEIGSLYSDVQITGETRATLSGKLMALAVGCSYWRNQSRTMH